MITSKGRQAFASDAEKIQWQLTLIPENNSSSDPPSLLPPCPIIHTRTKRFCYNMYDSL